MSLWSQVPWANLFPCLGLLHGVRWSPINLLTESLFIEHLPCVRSWAQAHMVAFWVFLPHQVLLGTLHTCCLICSQRWSHRAEIIVTMVLLWQGRSQEVKWPALSPTRATNGLTWELILPSGPELIIGVLLWVPACPKTRTGVEKANEEQEIHRWPMRRKETSGS